MKTRSTVLAMAVSATLGIGSAQAANVVVAVPNWPSAEVGANIIAGLMEQELGVSPILRDMGTSEIFDAIDRGEVDVHPEVWLPNLQRDVDEYVSGRGTVALAPLTTDAGQGMCTTRQTQESTGLQHISDLAKPEIAAHFDTDSDGRGEVWIGAHEWSSTKIERVRARSYGYYDTMMLLEMPENLAMAAIDAAVVTGHPIVFYCYSPHFVFQLHDIVQLDEPDHDPAVWNVVSPNESAAWLAQSHAPTAWQPSTFQIAYATYLDDEMPEVTGFLKNVTFTTEEAEAMSYAIDVEQRAPADVAAEWIENNNARWKEWLK